MLQRAGIYMELAGVKTGDNIDLAGRHNYHEALNAPYNAKCRGIGCCASTSEMRSFACNCLLTVVAHFSTDSLNRRLVSKSWGRPMGKLGLTDATP